MSVLVVGVGAMGEAIAARLSESGTEVWGVDPFLVQSVGEGAAEVVTADGIRVLGGLSAAAKALPEPPSDVLIFVRMGAQVVEVLEQLGSLEFFDGVPAAVLSTLAPSAARDVLNRFGAGRPLAETPVSGGIAGARAGALTVMAYGPTGQWLGAAAGRTLRFSKPGQPAIAKLLNNLLAAANVQALAAVLLSAEEHGLGVERMLEVVGHSSGASWMTPHFENFPIDLLWKDVLLLDGDAHVRLPGLAGDTEFRAIVEAAREALRP